MHYFLSSEDNVDSEESTEMDMDNLLACLRCHEDNDGNDSVFKETLNTISVMCSSNERAKDALRQVGGLKFLSRFLLQAKNESMQKSCLLTLATSIDKNVYNQQYLTTKEMFEYIHTNLDRCGEVDVQLSLLRPIIFFLMNLISGNSAGQSLMLDKGCLQDLIKLYRMSFPSYVIASGESGNFLEPSVRPSLTLWQAINAVLCFAVNNPCNEKNQLKCATLFTFCLKILDRCQHEDIIRGITSFMALTIADNRTNQDILGDIGGLTVLHRCLQTWYDRATEKLPREDEGLPLAVVLNIWDAAVKNHPTNAKTAGQLGVIPLLLHLMEISAQPEIVVKATVTLCHCVDSCEANCSMLLDAENLPNLIREIVASKNEDIEASAKYLLCLCIEYAQKHDLPQLQKNDTSDQFQGEAECRESVYSSHLDNTKTAVSETQKLAARKIYCNRTSLCELQPSLSTRPNDFNFNADVPSPVPNNQCAKGLPNCDGNGPEEGTRQTQFLNIGEDRFRFKHINPRTSLQSGSVDLRNIIEDNRRTNGVRVENPTVRLENFTSCRSSVRSLVSSTSAECRRRMRDFERTDRPRIFGERSNSITNCMKRVGPLNGHEATNTGNKEFATSDNIFRRMWSPSAAGPQNSLCRSNGEANEYSSRKDSENVQGSSGSKNREPIRNRSPEIGSTVSESQHLFHEPRDGNRLERRDFSELQRSTLSERNVELSIENATDVFKRSRDVVRIRPVDRNFGRSHSSVHTNDTTINRRWRDFVDSSSRHCRNGSDARIAAATQTPSRYFPGYRYNVDNDNDDLKNFVPLSINNIALKSRSLDFEHTNRFRQECRVSHGIQLTNSSTNSNEHHDQPRCPSKKRYSEENQRNAPTSSQQKLSAESNNSISQLTQTEGHLFVTPPVYKTPISSHYKSQCQNRTPYRTKVVPNELQRALNTRANKNENLADLQRSKVSDCTPRNISSVLLTPRVTPSKTKAAVGTRLSGPSSRSRDDLFRPTNECPGCNSPSQLKSPLLHSQNYFHVISSNPNTCNRHRFSPLAAHVSATPHVTTRDFDPYIFTTPLSEQESDYRKQCDRDSPETSEPSSKMPPPSSVPRRKRIPFTAEEEKYLLEGAEKMNKNWKCIMWSYDFHATRTAVDLYDKYRRMQKTLHRESPSKKTSECQVRVPFTPNEDRRIARGVRRFGYNWKLIRKTYKFESRRTATSLSERWRNLCNRKK